MILLIVEYFRQTEIKKQKPDCFVRQKNGREGLAVVSLTQVSIWKKEETRSTLDKIKMLQHRPPYIVFILKR